MSDRRKNILITIIIFVTTAAAAAGEMPQQQLDSPLTAQTFYDIGYELYTARDANFASAMQAIIFMNASLELDSRANYVLGDIINIAWQYPNENFSDVVKLALNGYIDRSTDIEVASKAVGYLLERLDSREQRELLLGGLIRQMTDKNAMFTSDLLAQLGFLKAETADTVEAQKYLARSFVANKYNRLAFAKLSELAEGGGVPLPDIMYLQNLRYAVRSNPLDFDSAFSFSRYCQLLGLYAPASAGYGYCADLLKYLNGKDSNDPALYRPWILSCYNAGQYAQCSSILQKVRGFGIFDIQVETIAAYAAKQTGDSQTAQKILDAIDVRANKVLSGNLKASADELADYVWLFSFAFDANSEDILVWATKAYDADQNSVLSASLFAYALVNNKQFDIAKSLLEKMDTTTQTAGLAKALLQIQSQDSNSAIETLKNVITFSSGTFEAKKAREKLRELDSEYIPAANPDAFNAELAREFGPSFFSRFIEPEKMVKLEFNVKGSAFSYGSEIKGSLAIMNNYTEPMVVCPDAMIKGNIRVDVKIAGDLNESIPALIEKRVRPSYEIRPGDALFIPLRLDTGKVKQILDSHPQAELNIEYTAYVDPQMTADGKIKNLLNTEPARVILKRRKLDLNIKYLQQRLDAIKRGHQGQKTRSVQMFAGLLAEQQEFRRSGPAYRFMYAEPELLSSALARCLTEDDWILKVQTMAAVQKLKLDYRLTEAISNDMHSQYWPARLMSVFTLANQHQQQFTPVLSWTVQNDPHPLVRQMAAILSGNSGLSDNLNDSLNASAKFLPGDQQSIQQTPAEKQEK
jgi:hypothetical protein